MVAEVWTWFDADDTAYILNDGTIYRVRYPIQGRAWPDYELVTDERYLQAGDHIKLIKVKAREMTLALSCFGTDASNLEANRRALEYAFDPRRGIGRLKLNTVDGQERDLDCYCYEWDSVESVDTFGCKFFLFAVSLHVPYPFWYDGTVNSQIFSAANGWTQDIDNVGDELSYPVWTIVSAADPYIVTITNNTTGYKIVLGTTANHCGVGVFQIITQKGSESVIKSPSINWAGYIDAVNTLDFFPLVAGINNITVSYTGTAPTSVAANWYSFYKGA
jgi:hypothetical protein